MGTAAKKGLKARVSHHRVEVFFFFFFRVVPPFSTFSSLSLSRFLLTWMGKNSIDAPKTPKAKATPKKRGKKGDADGEADAEAGAGAGAEDGSPKKKQRKTPVKKGKKAAEEEEAAGIKGEDMDEAA